MNSNQTFNVKLNTIKDKIELTNQQLGTLFRLSKRDVERILNNTFIPCNVHLNTIADAVLRELESYKERSPNEVKERLFTTIHGTSRFEYFRSMTSNTV